MDKISFFLLNVFVNSFLAFITALILIEGVIFLFRIRQGRVAALLRMIPILKLPLDLSLYDFSRWCYAHGVNPFFCPEGSRAISVFFGTITGLEFTALGDLTFTVADVIAYSLSPLLLKLFVFLFSLLTAVSLIRKGMHYYKSAKEINSIAVEPDVREIENPILKQRVKRYQIAVSAGSPFVAGFLSYVVYVPGQITGKEYEAVLAHEVEHIRHKDSLVRLTLDIVESVFWWVPTKRLRGRIEEGQEVGCDLGSRRYGVDPLDLASAICKCARLTIKSPALGLTRHPIHNRINILLSSSLRTAPILVLLATGIGFLSILLGRFWIF